ncbi:XkdX family protein [Bacillus atrophaeus]|uniref:XkdX family protein n=1 Tax=Bacillus atrophaeus TaxID=1452 RepID=UPI002281F5EC|nr:XkdX family protein [Bacillus atrophaeus]MCY8915664.1 XkdX family protein [Bacillus atrophaeus]MCY8924296.1 XkdX family protein [Bacillus atrophaeus]MCY9112091.1 XkdX family protein [Bacillus atrophaeus]MEC2310586.1 XkdX family protein [Bacillus atrophaeus]
MEWYKSIRTCYKWGCYTEEDVHAFVQYNKITEDQYQEIVKEEKTVVVSNKV